MMRLKGCLSLKAALASVTNKESFVSWKRVVGSRLYLLSSNREPSQGAQLLWASILLSVKWGDTSSCRHCCEERYSPVVCWESGSGFLENVGLSTVLTGSGSPTLVSPGRAGGVNLYSDLNLGTFFFLICRRRRTCFPLVRGHTGGFCCFVEHSNR